MRGRTESPSADVLEGIRKDVALLLADHEDCGQRHANEIERLEREKVHKQIELDRVNEKHQREKREIEHMVGLHRQRVDQEIELAKREQVITLREENLTKDRERFEQEMRFMRERMESEVERLNGFVTELLDRMPTVTVDRRIRSVNGAGPQ